MSRRLNRLMAGQKRMRKKNSGARRGRPLGWKKKPDVNMSELRFLIFNLINKNHSPEATAAAIKKLVGVEILGSVIREWRNAGYPITPLDATLPG